MKENFLFAKDVAHNVANLPVDGPLVGLKLGLWVKCHTDRGISCYRGCWDVDLCGLGVLLSVARHLGRHKAETRGTLLDYSYTDSKAVLGNSCRVCLHNGVLTASGHSDNAELLIFY